MQFLYAKEKQTNLNLLFIDEFIFSYMAAAWGIILKLIESRKRFLVIYNQNYLREQSKMVLVVTQLVFKITLWL